MLLQLLTEKLLSDIRAIRPEQADKYSAFFDRLLTNKYAVTDGFTLSYDAMTSRYDLRCWERGQPVGGILESSVDSFRVRFIKDFLFPSWSKAELEAAIRAMYPVFGQSEALLAFVHHCETMPRKPAPLGVFDFATMTFSDMQR